jgi:hypothetical protein
MGFIFEAVHFLSQAITPDLSAKEDERSGTGMMRSLQQPGYI